LLLFAPIPPPSLILPLFLLSSTCTTGNAKPVISSEIPPFSSLVRRAFLFRFFFSRMVVFYLFSRFVQHNCEAPCRDNCGPSFLLRTDNPPQNRLLLFAKSRRSRRLESSPSSLFRQSRSPPHSCPPFYLLRYVAFGLALFEHSPFPLFRPSLESIPPRVASPVPLYFPCWSVFFSFNFTPLVFGNGFNHPSRIVETLLFSP